MTWADRPLAILGPTASGKSGLAMEVARRRPAAEIVSADSMQVYRGMDIGTATPSAADQAEAPHHLLNLVEPEDEFTAAEFAARARAVLDDIRGRGALGVLVGGTGLYLRAVVDDLKFPGRFPAARAEIEAEPDTAALHRRLSRLDPVAADRMEPSNRRRVVRALEVTIGGGRPFSSYGPGLECYRPTRFAMVGLRWARADLDARIAARFEQQLRDGFLDEVRALSRRSPSRTAGQALGYGELRAHLRGDLSLEEAVDRAVTRTRQFARRQMRWFRRDPRIVWFDAPADATDVLAAWDDTASRPAGAASGRGGVASGGAGVAFGRAAFGRAV